MTIRLPVVGSTAKTTAFCSARVDGPGGLTLYMDGNGKVTAGNGTLHEPRPNSFSLPAAAISGIDHCPGSTPTCRAECYVGPLSKAQAELYAMYEHNAKALRTMLSDYDLASAWVIHVATWIRENAAEGFRWHVSGDVISIEHAQWIADVVRESAPVRSWIYTRSFKSLAPLVEVSTVHGGNLALNLSCDQDNITEAERVAEAYAVKGQTLRLCYLTVDGTVPRNADGTSRLYEGDVIFPTYGLRPRQFATLAESPWWATLSRDEKPLVCVVDAHGKSEKRRCHLTDGCNRCLK